MNNIDEELKIFHVSIKMKEKERKKEKITEYITDNLDCTIIRF